MPIEIKGAKAGAKVFLDEKYFGQADDALLWPVQLGKHHLQLISSEEKILDEVRFEVR